MRDREVTRILNDLRAGRRSAAGELLPVVYGQLRAIAQQRMGAERGDHTLQATALVHEAYLRLVGDEAVEWEGRGHFYAAAAEAMRRILVEHARARARVKRGGPPGERRRITLGAVDLAAQEHPEDFLILEESIRRMEEQAPEMAEIVRLRFFGGLSVEQTARALGVSEPTVKRRWAWARAWLFRECNREQSGDDEH